MSVLGLAWRTLWREWRSGELSILLLALVLAVTVVSGISAFAASLQNALEQESHRFLAADLVVRHNRPPPEDWAAQARERGLGTARLLTFNTMAASGSGAMHLSSVKAATDAYPLRGELGASAAPYAPVQAATAGPGRGEVWLDPRLFELLGVAVGGRVQIGTAQFEVGAAIRSEPDQGSSLVGVAPRVLMHYADVADTHVVQPGSRVTYHLLLAGDPERVASFRRWLASRLESGQRLVSVEDGQPTIARALDRARRFLLLAGSMAVVLAGVAVALSARRFSARQTDTVAVMKSFGARTGLLHRLYGAKLVLLAAIGSALGSALGWGVKELLLSLFRDQIPVAVAGAGWVPFAAGAAAASLCLLAFAWPPVFRLTRVSPLRVLRRDADNRWDSPWLDFVLAALAVVLLMGWSSRDWQLTAGLLGGLAATLAGGALIALVVLQLGRRAGMLAGSFWRLGLAGLQRRRGANALQVVMFAMTLLMLLLMAMLRTTLVEDWRAQLPPGAPNHFLINVAPAQVESIDSLLAGAGIDSEPLYPMVRGRVEAVNGVILPGPGDSEDGPEQQEANFTWSDALPPDNELVAGRWWEPGTDEALVSVEQGFAERGGIGMGDRLTLAVGSERFQVRVASIRELDWQTMKPNFFMVFPRRVLADFSATYITSFYLPPEKKPFLNRLVRAHPTVTIIEMDRIVAQIREVVARVSTAIEVVLLVVLAAGALVLIAGVRASVDERMQESALLRALGARRRLILGSLAVEFAALGLCAGALGVLGAEVAAYILQEHVLGLGYSPTPAFWLPGLLAGVCLIGCLGVLSCRRVVAAPPLVVLREG